MLGGRGNHPRGLRVLGLYLRISSGGEAKIHQVTDAANQQPICPFILHNLLSAVYYGRESRVGCCVYLLFYSPLECGRPEESV
jgi:hypothetical protein